MRVWLKTAIITAVLGFACLTAVFAFTVPAARSLPAQSPISAGAEQIMSVTADTAMKAKPQPAKDELPMPPNAAPESMNAVSEPTAQTAQDNRGAVTITVSAAGDCIPGNELRYDTDLRFPNAMLDAAGDYGWFFRNVQEYFGADDLTIVNLEGSLTDCTEEEPKEYHYRGNPANARVFSEGGVEVVSLANNHSMDYLEQGYLDTKDSLSASGTEYVEDGGIKVIEVKGLKVAIAASCYDNSVYAKMKAMRPDVDLMIYIMHAGTMYDPMPSQTQTGKAKWAIASGADLVIGHHPHIVQRVEEYCGKPVVFSLGNFSYGGTLTPTDTFIYQQTFTFIDGKLQSSIDSQIIPCSTSSISGQCNFQPAPYEKGSEEYDAFWEMYDQLPYGFASAVEVTKAG